MKKQILDIFNHNPVQTLIALGFIADFISIEEDHLAYRVLKKDRPIKVSLFTGDWYHFDGIHGGDLFDLFAHLHDLPKDLARHQLVNEVARALGVEDNIYG